MAPGVLGLHESGKVSPRESPAKGRRGFLVAILQGKQGTLQSGKAGEIAGSKHFALNDGEVDLDLLEPTGPTSAV
jgi:hypothetical protein